MTKHIYDFMITLVETFAEYNYFWKQARIYYKSNAFYAK